VSQTIPSLVFRFGLAQERENLEDLQRRASLVYEAYRDALLASPGVIHLPLSQLEQQRVRLAESCGHIAGFSVVLPREPESCELDGLFVEPGQWKSGIGRALMQDAFALARAQDARIMHVLANPYAEGFYEKLGFVRTGIVQTQLGIGSKMHRRL
jgi:GNAT superfamily N-acetyltransferase